MFLNNIAGLQFGLVEQIHGAQYPYLLTPWCTVLLEKLTGLQLVKKFPAFHGTQRFITALTSIRHLSLSWASPIQSIYTHPTSWRSVLILSAHLRLGLPSGLLPSGFPTKTLHTPLSSPICATCPAHLILLNIITRTILGEEYKSFNSSCNFFKAAKPIKNVCTGHGILLKGSFKHFISLGSDAVPFCAKFDTHEKLCTLGLQEIDACPKHSICDDHIRLNSYSEVLLIVGMHEHVQTSSKSVSSQCDIK